MSNIKVLPLQSWMKRVRSRERTLEYYKPTYNVFNKPNIYKHLDICWFELEDGRSFIYDIKSFNNDIELLEPITLSMDEINALRLIQKRNKKILSSEQKNILRLFTLKNDCRQVSLQFLKRKSDMRRKLLCR